MAFIDITICEQCGNGIGNHRMLSHEFKVPVGALATNRLNRAKRLGQCAQVGTDAMRPGVVCQLPKNHEGEHRDRVMAIQWDTPTPASSSNPTST